jgi:hypothetical protein
MNQTRTFSPLSGGGFVLAIAALLGLTPWLPGMGWAWAALFVAGGVALWQNRLPQSLVTPFVTLALGVAAFLLYPGLGVLPWLLACWLLIQGLGPQLEWKTARRGFRLMLVGACAVCLYALRQTWFETPSTFFSMPMGGLDYTFGWAPGTPAGVPGAGMSWYWQYNTRYIPYFMPGFEMSGQSAFGALWATIFLTWLTGWSLWRDQAARLKWKNAALAGSVALVLWSLSKVGVDFSGPKLFLLASMTAAFAAWKIGQGIESGDFDPEDLARRVRAAATRR